MIVASATIGYVISEDQIGVKNEKARAATPGALYSQLMNIAQSMYAVGFPANVVTTYALAQIMLESDWMTSSVGNEDKNYTGITFLNKPYQDATRGSARPQKEGGGNYARFATFDKFLKDYLRILSLNTGKMGRPIDATTANQFGERLKANHYFTDPNYYSKFNAALRKVTEALKFGQEQDKNWKAARDRGETVFTADAQKGVVPGKIYDQQHIEATANGLKATWDNLPTWEKWIAGILAGIVVVKLIK